MDMNPRVFVPTVEKKSQLAILVLGKWVMVKYATNHGAKIVDNKYSIERKNLADIIGEISKDTLSCIF
jgi:hypothetical protein